MAEKVERDQPEGEAASLHSALRAPHSAFPTQPLVILAAAFAAGIVADRYLSLRVEIWWLAAVGALSVWLIAWRWRANRTAAAIEGRRAVGCRLSAIGKNSFQQPTADSRQPRWDFALRPFSSVLGPLSLLTAVAALGAARHHLHWSVFPVDDLGRVADEAPRPICAEVVALENPRWRPAPAPTALATFERGDQTQLDVRILRVRDGDQWRAASGKAELIVEGHLLAVRAGDRLRIDAEFQRPNSPLNPGEFDFAEHHRARRKLCLLRADHPDAVKVVRRGFPLTLRRLLGAVRDRGDALLWRYVGHERAALASALLLGSREQLDWRRREPFLLTGMMHVLAISGLHVGILIGGFWAVVRIGLLRRRATLWTAIVLVAVYALLTGAQPPVVRAAVLIAVLCVGRLLGRPLLAFNTLAAAGLVVLAINPAELFGVGAQLSFLAVGALAMVGPRLASWRRPPEDPLDRLIAQTRPWPRRAMRGVGLWAAQLTAASAAVWLAVLPLTMLRFHVVAPAAVLLNLAAWVPLTIAMFAGFCVLIGGELFSPWASLCGAVCDLSLAVLERLILATQRFFDVHFWTPGPARWWVVGCYAGWAAWAAFPNWRPPRRWLIAIVAAWMAVGLAPPDHGFPPVERRKEKGQRTVGYRLSAIGKTSFRQPTADSRQPLWDFVLRPLSFVLPPRWELGDLREEELVCTFIAVGHGVSVLVEMPDGRMLLYDAGSLGPPAAGGRSIAAVLWSRGLRHVDAVVLSHADADHYNALPELLKMFSVGAVYVSPVMFDEETEAITELRRAIHEAGVPLEETSQGDRFAAGPEVFLKVLHPPPSGVAGSDNANSIVLHIESLGRRLLLTGDLEGTALADLLQEEPVDYDAVLAPHHGSRHSDPHGFAAWTTPEATIISGGRNDISEDVNAAYRHAGSRVFHTAQDGAVRVTLRRNGMFVQTWREERAK